MNRLSSIKRWSLLIGWCLAAVAAAVPARAADLGWHGFELRGGATFPADWDQGYTVAAAADLGEITRGLRLVSGLSYSQADTTDPIGFGFELDREVTTYALGAEVRWHFSGGDDGFYVGGGPYLHRLKYEVGVTDGVFGTTSDVESDSLGIEGVAGYSFGGRFNVEARYDTVSVFKGAQLLVGIRFGG